MDEKIVNEKDEKFSNGSTAEDGYVVDVPTIDHAAEAKLIRKLDLYIIPPVMLLYLLSFLDRVNIGNARLYGLEEDLGLVGDQYQIAVSLLFVTYVCGEVPSNLVLKKFTPSRWIAFITVAWGIIATLTGLVQNFAGLIACRLLLGLFEAGLFPGLTIYLTLFYTKKEIALRVAYLFVSAATAGSVGGLLAYGIGHMDGLAGQSGWRWILILEGIPTVFLGIAAYFWLADEPETAYYLSAEERNLVHIRKIRQIGYSSSADRQNREDVMKGVRDWKIWVFAAGQFAVDTLLYGYSTFLPTIIKGLGKWSTAQTQALTIPCYALGAITYLTVAMLSDRYQMRGLAAVPFCIIAMVGYGLLMADVSPGVHYFGCFVVALGLYVAVGIPLAWLPSNQPRFGKRAFAGGIQLTIGNMAGIMAPFLYKTKEAPRFIRGHAVTASMAGVAAVLYTTMSIYFWRRNKARKAGKEDSIIHGKTNEEIADLGDENPGFVFTY